MVKMIIKLGLAKDDKQASIVMIGIAVLALVVMVVFWPRSRNTPATPPLPAINTNLSGGTR